MSNIAIGSGNIQITQFEKGTPCMERLRVVLDANEFSEKLRKVSRLNKYTVILCIVSVVMFGLYIYTIFSQMFHKHWPLANVLIHSLGYKTLEAMLLLSAGLSAIAALLNLRKDRLCNSLRDLLSRLREDTESIKVDCKDKKETLKEIENLQKNLEKKCKLFRWVVAWIV